MKGERIIKYIIFFSVLLTMSRIGEAQEKEPEFIIKLAAIAPEGTHWADIATEFSDYVWKHSEGRIKVLFYLGGVMGDEPDVIRKIRLGQLHGGIFTAVGLEKILPEIRVITLPNLFNDYGEVDFVLGRLTPKFKEMFAEQGYILFGWVEVGFAYFFSTKYIMTMDDLRKTKIWTWSGYPLVEKVAQIMNYGTTVPLAFPDVLMGLKTGLIDTFFSPLYAAVATQWFQYAKYVNMAPVAYTPGGALLDKKIFDKMPKDLQEVFLDGAELTISKCADIIRREHMVALEGMKRRGIKVLEPPKEVREENDKAAMDVYLKLGEQYYPKWLFEGIIRLRAEYRAGKKEQD